MSEVSLITNGFRVSVDTHYRNESSDPTQNYFLFSYHISIQNNTAYNCKLLRRYWFITESTGEIREVEGTGVVGEQPFLAPGASFDYSSSCHFNTEIGKMVGHFLMINLETGNTFIVDVPEFQMTAPARLN
jgi:ApaG protein